MTSPRGKIDRRYLPVFLGGLISVVNRGIASPIVVTSGATATGLGLYRKGGHRNIQLHEPVIGHDGTEIDLKRALAAAGQPELMHNFNAVLRKKGLIAAQVMATHEDFQDQNKSREILRAIDAQHHLGMIAFFNGNDPVSREGFHYDNDRITADLAISTGAEKAVILTETGGFKIEGEIIDQVPFEDQAELSKFTYDSVGRGTGGMTSKLEQIIRMTGAGTTVHLVGRLMEDELASVCAGSSEAGTTFLPAS